MKKFEYFYVVVSRILNGGFLPRPGDAVPAHRGQEDIQPGGHGRPQPQSA